jgi:hypothetical protein
MDPIHPIAPGPPILPSGGPERVKRQERVAPRDRDRPARDDGERRGPAYRRSARVDPDDEDDGRPHIDVLV